MNKRKVIVKTHGKVILIGEHSVVYGKDAMALPIHALNIDTSVEAYHDGIWMDTLRYQGPYLTAPAEYNGLKHVVKKILSKIPTPCSIKITYTGEIPMERGLGSSAVVALGTARALNKYFALKMTSKEITDITNEAETINHGKASGLDAATVQSDYLVFFNKNMGPKVLSEKLGATLLIMDTGELGNTKEAVSSVKYQIEHDIAKKEAIDKLGYLADQTKDYWFKKDAPMVGTIFNEAQHILANFGLSTTRINNLCNIANQNGAYGCKLSGGGLGGIVIALCPNQEVASSIAQLAINNYENYWIEEI